MTLSDKTIINSNIKFLGTVYLRNGMGVFDFNGHLVRAENIEAANALRDEIIEKIPEADTVKKDLDSKWEEPPASED